MNDTPVLPLKIHARKSREKQVKTKNTEEEKVYAHLPSSSRATITACRTFALHTRLGSKKCPNSKSNTKL